MRILSLFFLLSMIHLYPILKNFFTMLPYATNGDVSLSLAILYSNIQKLGLLQFNQIYHLPFLFPLSHTMTIGFTLFGQSVLLLPFFLFGQPNIYALYNGITIFSYLAAGFGAYLFFKELQDNETVSIISAGLYILLPFRVNDIPHLNLLFNFPIPLCFLFLLRYLKNSRKKDLIFLNVFLLSQFLFDLSLGFYLSISLAIFVLIFALVKRPVPLPGILGLLLSLLTTMAVILLIHFPFLQKDISLSPSDPSFNPRQYIPALSFYANKSYLLLFLDRIWDTLPLFPGFSVVFFYFYAFSSFISNIREKILLAVMVGSYVVPGAIAVVFFQKQGFERVDSITEIGLMVLFVSLALLVFMARKKIPLNLKLVSLLFLSLLFISFNPFPRIFDFFNALAKFFPFLHRSRGMRVLYIMPLLMIGMFSIGISVFLEKKRNKKIYLWAIVLILLLEHFRWPVAMAKLPELNVDTKKIYQMVDPYPPHFGILELPFLPASSNTYSFLTRYHNKHTYHGYYLIYADPLNIGGEDELRVDNEFRGLANQDLIKKLKDNGLYLIIINGSFIPHVYDGDLPAIWRKIRQNIQRGQQLGLFKEIKEQPTSILIVLDDGRTGQDITYSIPYFALVGEKNVKFKIRADQPTRSQIYLNGRLIAENEYPRGEHDISFDFRTAPKQNQINQLRLVNDHPLTVNQLEIK
ncbi:MAG: hypothetical protein NTU60_07935 [Candidatus Aminicenantes bacterium]|nr:hypothetical protein [Candidatus Aminicenantes bacterium]